MHSKTVFGTACLMALFPGSAFAKQHYEFSKSRPPLLAKFGGNIYDIADNELQQVQGVAEWSTHTSAPVTGTENRLNTDKTIRVAHRYFWTLSAAPVRYGTDEEHDVKTTVGYSKTSRQEMEKNLGFEAGISGGVEKVFGFSEKITASLKLSNTETQEWREETEENRKKTYKAHTFYCRWTLIDELTSRVETRVSTDPMDKPASGAAVSTFATFKNIALIYEDDAPDPVAKILFEAIKGFGALKTDSSMLAPAQLE